MEDGGLNSTLCRPSVPPGLCRQCALCSTTCVQARCHARLGAPAHKLPPGPPRAHPCAASHAPASSSPRERRRAAAECGGHVGGFDSQLYV
jgi:hypothetical protein